MSITVALRARAASVLMALLAVLIFAGVAQAGPPPARPDPKQMSGLGRVDPGLASGKLSVRCLLGGFESPATDTKVELELTAADGARKETKEGTTDAAGRVTFEGLEPFLGGVAVATATLDGEQQRSGPLAVSEEGGTRVMLVKGAKTVSAAGGSQHGGQGAMPLPGKPFPLPERDAGSLVVGALDLDKGEAIVGIEVILHVRPVDAADDDEDLITKRDVTDEKGRVVFENLGPPTVPEGAKVRVEAVLYDGQAPKISDTFAMGETGQAVVLTHGVAPMTPPAPPSMGMGRPKVPGPRKDARLPAGTVQVRLWGPKDEAIADQKIRIVRKAMAGGDRTYEGTTNAEGIALVDGIERTPDSFFLVRTTYDSGPYESTFFELPERVGAAVDLRVFPTTSDPTKVKSAVQYDVIGLERDKAQVVQVYEVLIEGDEAYWPKGGLRVHAADGGKSVVVLPQATRWLAEIENAPYAELGGPIPPGEVAQLSIAYIVDHSGKLELNWNAPFQVMSAGVLIDQGYDLEVSGPVEREPSPHGVSQRGDAQELVSFVPTEQGGTLVSFKVEGLPTRSRWPWVVAWSIAGLVVLIVSVAIFTRRRTDLATSLRERRTALEARLRQGGLAMAERAEVAHALDRVIRKLEAMRPAGPPANQA